MHFTFQTILSAATFLLAANAEKLFIGTYGGALISADFSESGTISAISTNGQSAPAPSWQETSANGKFLYTVEEAPGGDWGKGAVTSYSIGATGELTKVQTEAGLGGPVSLTISPLDQSLIFTASYGASGVAAYETDPETGALKHLESWTYTMDGPGPVPSRQEAPHPHQAMFDPTGRFVVVPDLGADKLRIFKVDGKNITQLEAYNHHGGSGPRHGFFVPSKGDKAKFYYLINELDNSISVFTVHYDSGEIQLREVEKKSTLPEPSRTVGADPNSTPSAAAYALAPSGDHLYISNRNDVVFNDSHSIAAYNVNQKTGRLSLIDYFPSGVLTPRHITIDPKGEYFIAEGQSSNNVKVFKIDAATGKLATTPCSEFTTEQPVCISWAQEAAEEVFELY